MKYKNLFFDLDRTLWDFDANSFKSLSYIFMQFNLQRYFSTPGEFREVYNHYNDQLWESYRKGKISKAKLRTDRFELTLKEKNIFNPELAREIGEVYMYATPRQNILAPNTIEILEYLSFKKYELYILTNGFISTQESKMRHSNLDHYFKRIFSSEELGVNKPKKEIFHWAVSGIHAHKKECLMIGDDIIVDIEGAMTYGIDAAWFNPKGLISDFQPTYNIRDLAELKSFL